MLDLTPQLWMQNAACNGMVTSAQDDFWHPDDDEPADIREAMIDKAKAICRSCPVLDRCTEYALDLMGRHGAAAVQGVYAGRDRRELMTLADERNRRRRKASPEHGTYARYKGAKRRDGGGWYSEPCRCDLCRAGNRRYNQRWRGDQRNLPAAEAG